MTTEQSLKIAASQLQQRSDSLPVGRTPVDREQRIVELSFLSEAPYTRSYGVEVLDHTPSSIDLEWMNSGQAPFLVAPNDGEGKHKGAVQAGSIVAGSVKVGPDRKTRGQVKISRSAIGDDFLNDYDDNIAINISSDYRQSKPQVSKDAAGNVTVRWMRVEPRGVTRVPFPADETVGVGRAAEADESTEDPNTSEVATLTAEEQRAANELAAQQASRAAELQRLDDIQDLGKRFKMEARADVCALEGKTVEETRSILLAEKQKEQADTVTREDRGDPGAGAKKEHPVITIHQTVSSFTDGTRAENAKQAYRFAQWFIGSVLNEVREFQGSKAAARAIQYCKDYSIDITRGQVEGDNTPGGFLVPHEFNNEMIVLRERFGVGRRNIRIVPMSTDSRSQPRRKNGLTAYVIGEGRGATESELGWDRVQLSTKKIGVLTKYSSEIAEDALVSIGDTLAEEISYAFSSYEDLVIFNGNGSKDHARIVGATTKLQNLEDGGGAAGVIEATGNTWDEFVLQDFLNVIGGLPEYAETPNVKWFCSKLFWATVMVRLAKAASGNDESDIVKGGVKQFLGYPVEISQKFPKTATNGKIMTLFGDLKLAGMMGDRRGTTIRTSDQQHWAEEEIDIAGSERFDVNIHDIGTDTEEGPLMALKCKSS